MNDADDLLAWEKCHTSSKWRMLDDGSVLFVHGSVEPEARTSRLKKYHSTRWKRLVATRASFFETPTKIFGSKMVALTFDSWRWQVTTVWQLLIVNQCCQMCINNNLTDERENQAFRERNWIRPSGKEFPLDALEPFFERGRGRSQCFDFYGRVTSILLPERIIEKVDVDRSD